MCAGELDARARHTHSENMAWFPSRLQLAPCLAFRSVALHGRRLALGAGFVLAAGCGGGQTGDEHSDSSGSIEELTGSALRLAASGDLPNSASADGWSFGWTLYAAEADPT